ncbi:hypothetical protein F9U64_14485 [Gracilibacillus oryzae]|uniref:PepSY domain-containing protein n=1 Tax=Gracilibacillus oryzae TaxID=1672701 RepID=A0A7C8L2J2_9BACI|nr:PepSY domain-containing protein [Gracilibacillus oryzae]KAB8130115.1 hypothetical protein F9U64_14485 [Gracilibacillus oryzae]
MKNKKLLITLTSLFIVGVAIAIFQLTPSSASAFLSEQEAKDKVQSQFSGEIVKLRLEEDDNRKVYDVEIRGTESYYDLELDAETGKILSLEEDILTTNSDPDLSQSKTNNSTADDNHDDKAANETKADNSANESAVTEKTNQTQTANATSNAADTQGNNDDKKQNQAANTTKTTISSEKAKSIALAQYNGTITELELDEDDGQMVYEIEIHTATNEIDIEINAYTGAVNSVSKDDLDE